MILKNTNEIAVYTFNIYQSILVFCDILNNGLNNR